MSLQIQGSVTRIYTAEKFGKLTLEYDGGGRYPEKLDFKTFDKGIIAQLGKLGNGESVTVDFNLQTEKVMVDGKEITQKGKDDKEYAVKVPMLKITGLSSDDGTPKGSKPPF